MSTNERPTPETDAFYMNRACVVEAEAMLEEWARGAEHARRLEQQRDALARSHSTLPLTTVMAFCTH